MLPEDQKNKLDVGFSDMSLLRSVSSFFLLYRDSADRDILGMIKEHISSFLMTSCGMDLSLPIIRSPVVWRFVMGEFYLLSSSKITNYVSSQ